MIERGAMLALAISFTGMAAVILWRLSFMAAPQPSVVPQSLHLPSHCAAYYNDGTTRWIDCMGVGYVPD